MPFYILEYTRSPRSFRECLLNSTELASVRAELASRGFYSELDASGAKFFVHGKDAKKVALALKNLKLYPRHVVVDADLLPIVESTIASATRKERVHVKTRVPLHVGCFVACWAWLC